MESQPDFLLYGQSHDSLGKKDQGTGGIATLLATKLRENKIYPPNTPYRFGATATLWSSETTDEAFFDSVQTYNPDGYIVGVGAGMMFVLLKCFPNGVMPKGIVLTDVQPDVVAFSKLFTQALEVAESKEDLIKNFFEMSDEAYKKSIQRIVNQEPDKELKKRFKKTDERYMYNPKPLNIWRGGPNWWESQSHRRGEGDPQLLDIPKIVLANFDLLHRLAAEGNIASAFASFTDPRFIALIKDLPEFTNSTNIIYYSNIVDIASVGVAGLHDIGELHAYERNDMQNIFIKAPQNNVGYGERLRLQASRLLDEKV